MEIIRESYQQTNDDAQLDKLQYAWQVAEQARDFIVEGDTGAAWLRLHGAVGFLRMAGIEVDAVQALQVRIDQAL